MIKVVLKRTSGRSLRVSYLVAIALTFYCIWLEVLPVTVVVEGVSLFLSVVCLQLLSIFPSPLS